MLKKIKAYFRLLMRKPKPKEVDDLIALNYINGDFNDVYHEVVYNPKVKNNHIRLVDANFTLLKRLKRLKPNRFNKISNNTSIFELGPVYVSFTIVEVLSSRVMHDYFHNLLKHFNSEVVTHSLILSLLLNMKHSELTRYINASDTICNGDIESLGRTYILNGEGVATVLTYIEDIKMYSKTKPDIMILNRCKLIKDKLDEMV